MARKLRKTNFRKELILAMVAAHPGLNNSAIARLSDSLPCRTRQILDELRAAGKVRFEYEFPTKAFGKKWFARKDVVTTKVVPELTSCTSFE